MFDFDEDSILDELSRAIEKHIMHIKPFYVILGLIVLFATLAYISWQATLFALFMGVVMWVVWDLMG